MIDTKLIQAYKELTYHSKIDTDFEVGDNMDLLGHLGWEYLFTTVECTIAELNIKLDEALRNYGKEAAQDLQHEKDQCLAWINKYKSNMKE